jgi:hypothetical protein
MERKMKLTIQPDVTSSKCRFETCLRLHMPE